MNRLYAEVAIGKAVKGKPYQQGKKPLQDYELAGAVYKVNDKFINKFDKLKCKGKFDGI